MTVDGAGLTAHDAGMLGRAIKRQLEATNTPAADLARKLGVDGSTVSRLLNGHVDDVSLGRVIQIENILGLPRGHLLRAARLIDDALTVRQRIESDPDLTADEVRIVLRAYDVSVSASIEERSKSGVKRAPAVRSNRRS